MEWLHQFLRFLFVASLLISTTAISDQTPKVYIYSYTCTFPLAYYVQLCYAKFTKFLSFSAALCCLYGKFITKQHWGRRPNIRNSSFAAIILNYSKVHYLVYYNFISLSFILNHDHHEINWTYGMNFFFFFSEKKMRE